MNIWETLPKPFFVLAPMDDVTDTVFRRIVAKCAAPDLFFTEFANVDGLQSPGRHAVGNKLRFYSEEKPLIAQIWGMNPGNFELTARELAERGFDGIDLNMGCPVKNVIKQGACSALIGNRQLAHDIIEATRKGAGEVPVSIKTRIGAKEYDESWIRFILEREPAVLTVHFRSVKDMSKVDARWEIASDVVRLRDEISPGTIIVGNGDVMSREQGLELAAKYNLDGIMIGRGIFTDPYIFSDKNEWHNLTQEDKIRLYRDHIEMFIKEWGDKKNPALLKKFAKVYINDFAGAKELRAELMSANSAAELLDKL